MPVSLSATRQELRRLLTVPADATVLRRSLNAITVYQAGSFTAAQALKAGYSCQSQKYHVDHGNWVRVNRALFRLPGWPTRDEDRYVLWRLWSHGLAVVSCCARAALRIERAL